VSQGTMDSPVVVVLHVRDHRHIGLGEGRELVSAETFTLQQAVERLDVRVLVGRLHRDVLDLHAQLVARLSKGLTRELGAVVATDHGPAISQFRCPAFERALEGHGGLGAGARQADVVVNHRTIGHVQDRLHEEEAAFSLDVPVFHVGSPHLIDSSDLPGRRHATGETLPPGSRPGKWCKLGSSALSAIYTPGTASNSRVSFNPFRAYSFFIDSWLKYRLGAAVHSSCCSMRTAPAKRISEARFGKIPTTSVRRPISRINRSNGFVECNCRQCSWGKAMYARMSSSASFSIWAALGKRCAKLCTTLASCPWADVLSGWAKTVRTRAATICCADFGTCDSRLRMKCTRQRCQLDPPNTLRIASLSPS